MKTNKIFFKFIFITFIYNINVSSNPVSKQNSLLEMVESIAIIPYEKPIEHKRHCRYERTSKILAS